VGLRRSGLKCRLLSEFSPAVFRFWFAAVSFSLELLTAAGYAWPDPRCLFERAWQFHAADFVLEVTLPLGVGRDGRDKVPVLSGSTVVCGF
jgi:hypothetical protein